MKKKWTIYVFLLVCLLQPDCTKQVKVPIRNVPPVLVVQGLVTTAPGPYTINLSYSGPYTNSLQATQQDSMYFIADAKVVIKDDEGDSTTCTYTSLGNYMSDNPQFIGTIGRTYTLFVYLSNGQEYMSKPETIEAVPPIDSLSIGYDSTGLTGILPPPLIVTVNTHDPGNGSHYYMWSGSGYYPRKSWGMPCNVYADPPCTDPYMCTCFALCEEENTAAGQGQVNVFSNQLSEGQEIIRPVYYSPVYWFGDHYVEIDQYSLTLESYQFWEQYLAQTDRTGSILDPLPSPVIGNIYNAADSTELALGIFSASDVYREKVVLVPFFLQEYELQSVAGQNILKGDCQVTYPNALPDNTAPPAWDSAQVIDIY
jgi:Domain of unknown function (DUF4249)